MNHFDGDSRTGRPTIAVQRTALDLARSHSTVTGSGRWITLAERSSIVRRTSSRAAPERGILPAWIAMRSPMSDSGGAHVRFSIGLPQ